MKKTHQQLSILALCALVHLLAPRPAAALDLDGQYAPVTVKPNDSTTIRFIAWNQVWARLIEQNPGTAIGGRAEDVTLDVGLRRIRLLALGQLGKSVRLMFHFGINNQTFRNNVFQGSGPRFFIHDAWTEFDLVDSAPVDISVGAGLTYWNGISRMTNTSSLNFLAVDAPITNWPTINGTDQFARQLGIYVKGALAGGLIDYRVSLNRPFSNGAFSPNREPNTWSVSSYVKLQLLDKEANTLPYQVGTYLGKKSVFNLGLGNHFHPEGSETAEGAAADIHLLGADVFVDLPVGEGAFTAYVVGYLYDFGRDLVRNVGIMNVADGDPAEGATFALNGRGNGYASIGDGISVYGQAGFLLPGKLGGLQIQPYITAQINAWDAYESAAPVLGGGVNAYMFGHHAKVTLHYRARPIMTGKGSLDRFASEVILQTMIFL